MAASVPMRLNVNKRGKVAAWGRWRSHNAATYPGRNMKTRVVVAMLVLLCAAACAQAPKSVAQDKPAPAAPILLRDCLILPPVFRGVRSLVYSDPVEYSFVNGTLKPPKADDDVTASDGKAVKWAAMRANDSGTLAHDDLEGGYCWWTVKSDAAQTRMLTAAGHVGVYVNGEPRIGEWYGAGVVHLPVRLKAGDNHFLFRCVRDTLSARLDPPEKDIWISASDPTLPDILPGAADYCAGIVVSNATTFSQSLAATATANAGAGQAVVANMPPLSVHKFPLRFKASANAVSGEIPLTVTIEAANARGTATDSREFKLRVRGPAQVRKVTFISEVDGSVQYYAVNPAQAAPGGPLPGIVLSCHGAGVEASGQAEAYGAKSWCHIVCPTNRRPYGFDWEDWGRLDAMEVLRHAKAALPHDPSMVYLTGHSMGGHGAWQLGAHFPDQFAAVGPSAGWRSFWSYAGKKESGSDPASKLLRRSENAGDTLLLRQNYVQEAIYILHGDADDNVPVTEARAMRDALKDFHKDLHYHEEPGAGHWWDRGDSRGDAGADCVDWGPMFYLFARRRLPAAGQVRDIDFTTISPGISADCHWATVAQQATPFDQSRIQLSADPNMRRISGTTDNVRLFALRAGEALNPGNEISLRVDGETLTAPWPADGTLWLERGKTWSVGAAPAPGAKNPRRGGGFKDAFRNAFVIVYGTTGDTQTNEWSLSKARYDAEHFWYRGNGAVEIIADSAFKPEQYLDRNIILVGNADTNSAFATLKVDCPVSAAAGKVQVGGRTIEGDLAVLAVYPRAGSAVASIGIISGSSLKGMRLTNRLAYLVAGVGVPDFVVLDIEMLRDAARGVRACGFFDNNWKISESDIVVR